jgi:hypothetical protein
MSRCVDRLIAVFRWNIVLILQGQAAQSLSFLETSVTIYQWSRRNIPEDSNLQQYQCGSTESRNSSTSNIVGPK